MPFDRNGSSRPTATKDVMKISMRTVHGANAVVMSDIGAYIIFFKMLFNRLSLWDFSTFGSDGLVFPRELADVFLLLSLSVETLL